MQPATCSRCRCANQYRQFQTYVRNYGASKIAKVTYGANADGSWTEVSWPAPTATSTP